MDGVKIENSGTPFTTSGSFAPISGTNGFGQNQNRNNFIYDFGAIEQVSDGAVLDDLLSQIGFTILSRNAVAGYPLERPGHRDLLGWHQLVRHREHRQPRRHR